MGICYCRQPQQVPYLSRHSHQSATMGMWKMSALDISPEKSWVIFTLQHQTHARHQNDWGERSTHQKWDSKENFFDILNIEEQIATQQLTFIGKVTRNSDNHIPTKLLTAWCNHKRRRGGLLHTNKKLIVHNLRLIIPGVNKTGALKTWAHFAIYDRYWQHLISGLWTSSTSTPPALPPPSFCM